MRCPVFTNTLRPTRSPTRGGREVSAWFRPNANTERLTTPTTNPDTTVLRFTRPFYRLNGVLAINERLSTFCNPRSHPPVDMHRCTQTANRRLLTAHY